MLHWTVNLFPPNLIVNSGNIGEESDVVQCSQIKDVIWVRNAGIGQVDNHVIRYWEI